MFQKRKKKKLMAIIRKEKTNIMIWKRKKVLKNPKIMKKRDFLKCIISYYLKKINLKNWLFCFLYNLTVI